MGMWDFEAWDNDSAADWFGGLMKETSLREKWLDGINRDPEDEYEVVRAAIWLFKNLGRVYIWPIDEYEDDLHKTIAVGEKLLSIQWMNEEVPTYTGKLKADLEEIKARRR